MKLAKKILPKGINNTQITDFFHKKQDNNSTNSNQELELNDNKVYEHSRKNYFMPKIVLDLMLATTKNSTSVYFGQKNMCCKHMTLVTMEHLEVCDLFVGQERIKGYATRLKTEKFLTGADKNKIKRCRNTRT